MDTTRAIPGGLSRPPARPAVPAGTRRRPSGEPPPLPRPVSVTTRLYAGLGVVMVVMAAVLRTPTGLKVIDAVDLPIVRAFERIRWSPLNGFAEVVVSVGSSATFRVLAWVVLIVLIASRRFQHLFASFVLLLIIPLVIAALREWVGRMRPAGIVIIGDWQGYAHPSRPVAELGLVLTISVLVLAPRGRWRTAAFRAAVVVLTLVVVARLYMGIDHPSDIVAALVLGVAIPVAALRLLTPEEAFPVTYRRGVRAHLDVGGRRGQAIRRAFARQLGVTVAEIEPFGLSGSAGSTPLRITTTEPAGVLFGKLYASTHLRSDRWYKLARTIRYGRLEDERPFNSVRRLVHYEDHMLRLFRDAGVATARPYGIVQITPEREYVLVTELLPDAVHLNEGEVTDDVVDQALRIVRSMWDAGLAHRDIKPANLLLTGGQVWLVDVAFAEVRPTPWREAVDLANMMLTLSLCVPAERVYERAVLLFTPDDVAEAFAASRAVTVPSQLRTMLDAADDDAAATFRRLAPERAPIAIQRWSVRRFTLTLAVVAGAVVAAALLVANLRLVGLL